MNLLTQATHGPALATAGSALSIAGMFGSVRDAIHTFAPVYAELIGMAVATLTFLYWWKRLAAPFHGHPHRRARGRPKKPHPDTGKQTEIQV